MTASARWKVLVSAPYMIPVLADYKDELSAGGIDVIVAPVVERLSEEELLRWARDVDGVIAGDDQFTERVLRECQRLKVISKWGTGVDSIDREAAQRLAISVCNTPGAFTDPVADTVLGYILTFARRIPWLDQGIRRGRWGKEHSGSTRIRFEISSRGCRMPSAARASARTRSRRPCRP